MEKVKITLLVLVVLLLAMQLLDRSHEPKRLKIMAERIEEAQDDMRRQQATLVEMLEQLSNGQVTVNHSNSNGGEPVNDTQRDGRHKLGVNFLKPVDNSHFEAKYAGGTLKYYEAAPKGFNPIVENSATANNAHSLMNGTLAGAHPRDPMLWYEDLATACIISDDYKTFTFKIRDNVYWQMPSIAREPGYEWLQEKVQLTAHDFQAMFDTIMDPNVECPQTKAYYEDVESVEAVDDLSLVIKWKRKLYVSLQASLSLGPLPRHVYGCRPDGSTLSQEEYGLVFNKHWFDEARQVIGCGAYMLDEYEPDKVISFKRNPDYYAKGYHFDRIVWDGQVRQQEPKLIGFKNGDVHYDGLPPTKYKSEVLDRSEKRFAAYDPDDPTAGREGAFGWERVKSRSYSYIGWNMRRDFFKDKRVRQAMTYAFPKQRIIDEVYYGIGRPQVTNVHPDSIYYNPNLKDYNFDLKKAAALLEEAGWTDSDNDGVRDKMINGQKKDFKFEVKYYANSVEWDSTLIIFKNELLKIGVVMDARNYEWKELLRVYEDKDFDAVSGGWRFGLRVDFMQLWHSKYANEPRSSNHCGFVNKRADEIAELLRDTFEMDERIKVAQEFQEIIHEEQPYTFFRSGEGIFIWQNRNTDKAQALRGVVYGFEHYHPLYSRTPLKWHFDNP